MKKSVWLIVLFLAMSCSEGLVENENAIVESNLTQDQDGVSVLYLVDEANQVIYQVRTDTFEKKAIAYCGNAANDIKCYDSVLFVTASLNHSVMQLDLAAQSTKTKVYPTYPTGPNPYESIKDGNRVYVTLLVGKSLSVLDAVSMTEITNIALIGKPMGITASSDKLFVALYDTNHIAVVSKANLQVLTNIPVIDNPQSLVLINDEIFIACTGAYNNSTWSYEGGGLVKMRISDYETNLMISNKQFDQINFYENKLFVLDNAYGQTKSGLNIYHTNGSFITNLLSGKSLKGMVFEQNDLYLSESYGGNLLYQVNLSNFQVTIHSNMGGGDLAIRINK